MLSSSSKNAIKAVLYLTNKASKENKISAIKIANDLEIPAPFLAKILQQLTKKMIISSVKGPNGGFYFEKNNNTNTLYDIIECIDSTKKFENCFLGQTECHENNPCVVHHLYNPFKNKLIFELKNKTILDMAKKYAKNNNTVNTL